MDINEVMLCIKCGHVSLEVFLDSKEHYLTGYDALSDCLPGRKGHVSGYYTVKLKLHESFRGHKLLLVGKAFQRELLMDDVLLHQANADGNVEVDLCEGKLVKSIRSKEWILSCDAPAAYELLYQEINHLQESSPAYVNACWQLMRAGNKEYGDCLLHVRNLIRVPGMEKDFTAFLQEFFERYNCPEDYRLELEQNPQVQEEELQQQRIADAEEPETNTAAEEELRVIPNEMRVLKEPDTKYMDLLQEIEAEEDEEQEEIAVEAVKEESDPAAEGPKSYTTEEELVEIPNKYRILNVTEMKYADILKEVEEEDWDDEDWDDEIASKEET